MTRVHSTDPIATFEFQTSNEQTSKFFDAVGWQLPDRPAMPPTLATVFRGGEFKALQSLNISLQKVLHGEQKYRFHRELETDKVYKGTTRLNSHTEKAKMNFYIFQTNLLDDTGAVYVECLTTIVIRG